MNEKLNKITRASASIDISIHASLKQHSLQTGLKMNHLIDDAIRIYLHLAKGNKSSIK